MGKGSSRIMRGLRKSPALVERLRDLATIGRCIPGQDAMNSGNGAPTLITGYMDDHDNVFCVDCWKKTKPIGGAVSMLDTFDPADPGDKTPFWVVDKCVLCGADVKYKDVRLLA
jgi:hypothetical protein